MSRRPLPDDIESLQRLVIEQQVALEAARSTVLSRDVEIEKLKIELARLKRMQFGRSSEQLDQTIAQLELSLEELEASAAEAASALEVVPAVEKTKPARRALPESLPRETVTHEAPCGCPACGGALRAFGEDVAEILEYVPSRFKVIRHVRPKFSCAACQQIVQAPAPGRPIARGLAGPGLLAHVLVSKYVDHLPLNPQSQIFAREGVDLDRSTLADWIGQASGLLRPLVGALQRHVLAGNKLHADDTPVPVLCPGRGTTNKAGFGPTFATIDPVALAIRRPCDSRTRRIEKGYILEIIYMTSAASYRPTDMPASRNCTTIPTRIIRSKTRHVGLTCAANFTTSTKPRNRRSR